MKEIKGEELKAIVSSSSSIENSYMMATTAYHYMGDISRDVPDLCIVGRETDDYFIGNWIMGFGFIDVLFPKETTRALTPEEIEYYNSRHVQINNQPPFKLKVDGKSKK